MAETLYLFQDKYQLDVQEVDLLEQPEVASQYGIWTTPAVIINGEFALVGPVKEENLREKLEAYVQRNA